MSHVFVNGRMALNAGDGQTQTCPVPDVCKTPSPGGPVPVPYVNVARDSDLAKGTKKVSIEGHPVALSSSNLSTSTGDEAGTAGGGIISAKTKGKVTWATFSPDVKFEGKNVVRFLDICLHNGNAVNTGGNAATGKPSVGLTYGADDKCPICGNPAGHELKSDKRSEKAAQKLYKRCPPHKRVRDQKKGYMAGVLRCRHPKTGKTVFLQLHSGNTEIQKFIVKPKPPSPIEWKSLGGQKIHVERSPEFKGPPVGSCAAQKLISEARRLGLEIKSMTEFWVGPINEEGRRNGHHYESCPTCKKLLPALLCPQQGNGTTTVDLKTN
ncbi:DUF4150 domain-containing protein [Archangium lansingense]|uniref:DUF4150 domain-containing protein n=1 Tax=Archangium lansingense TaxID=2995310 RepID=UPI00358DA272